MHFFIIELEREVKVMYQNSYQPYQNQNCYYNVNGYEGAKNFQLAPNQSVLLIDTMQPYLYYKSANQMGQITIKTYKLEELADNPEKLAQNELLGAFDARLKAIEEKLNAKSVVKCNVSQ